MLSVAEIEKAAAGFVFVGGLAMWETTVCVRRDTGIPVLWMGIHIPDSTDPTCSRMQPLHTGIVIDEEALAKDERTPERFVADELRKLFLHEFYESLLVRGQRLFDPHNPDAHHPGAT